MIIEKSIEKNLPVQFRLHPRTFSKTKSFQLLHPQIRNSPQFFFLSERALALLDIDINTNNNTHVYFHPNQVYYKLMCIYITHLLTKPHFGLK